MILGITGGIATGKSTVSHMFETYGAVLIDADQIAREVVEPGTVGLQEVVKEFGEGILDAYGKLNREALGKIIFADEKKRHTLERILHPLIREKLMEDTKQALHRSRVVIWDIPLLIERKMMPLVDQVILVYAPKDVQVERLIKRNSLLEEEALMRIQSQMDIEDKRKYADIIIDNHKSLDSTQRQVDEIWHNLTRKDQN